MARIAQRQSAKSNDLDAVAGSNPATGASKRCTICKKLKSVNGGFYTWHGKARADCKECHKKKMRPRSKSHYISNKEYYKRRNINKRKLLRELTKNAKTVPCADCGKQYPPWVMDFDHLPQFKKVNNIGVLVWSGATNKLKAEMKKCDIICANCHRERTHKRLLSKLHRSS